MRRWKAKTRKMRRKQRYNIGRSMKSSGEGILSIVWGQFGKGGIEMGRKRIKKGWSCERGKKETLDVKSENSSEDGEEVSGGATPPFFLCPNWNTTSN